ncbi:GNAT family N-acetyltransferase [Brevibacillus agri]|uniref:GNAT family N-acetyltransferase n=1 Tax=Brevibacillus agri TaxID=51101 RepID=UPI00399D22AC
MRQIKEWAFREQKAHRLWLDVKETNGVARALYLSEGFREEGILRDCLKTGDTYESLVVLSMLADEYEA